MIRLRAALPILTSKRRTVVLLAAQLSLFEVVEDPTPITLVGAVESLHARMLRQDYFNTDHWGERVTRVSKANVLRMQTEVLETRAYDDRILAAVASAKARVESLDAREVDLFDVR